MATTAYTAKDWNTGDIIAETDLDHIEQGVKAATDAVIALEGQEVKQGASYRISTETFSASKADCQASAVSPGADTLPIIVGDLIEDATKAIWQVTAVSGATFTVGAAAVRAAPAA